MAASTSVFLNVADIDRSLKFYKALGFRVTSSTKGEGGRVAYADLEMDGAELGLGSIPSSTDEEFHKWVSTPLGAGVVTYLTLPRGGVDRVFSKAKKAGAIVELDPTDRRYGRVAMIDDPDGYVLSLHEAPVTAKKARRAPSKRRTAGARRRGAKKRAR